MTEAHTDDLREYYFSNDPQVAALWTVELRHPGFIDEDTGENVAVRFVNDANPLTAKLEDDAPMNPGEEVTFLPGRFDITLPESTTDGLPQFQLNMGDVIGELSPWLAKAIEIPQPVELSFREYLSDEPQTPGFLLHGLTIGRVNGSPLRVVAMAGYEDLLNKPFGRREYTAEDFRGLVR